MLKVPFSVGRAEVMAPLLCGESKALPLSAAAVKHGQMLSHWCALYVVSGKKRKYVKKKAFFSSLSYFAEQGKNSCCPSAGLLAQPLGRLQLQQCAGSSGCPPAARGARLSPSSCSSMFCLQWVREQPAEVHLAGGELWLQPEPPRSEKIALC